MQKTKKRRRLRHGPLTLILIFLCVGIAFFIGILAVELVSEFQQANREAAEETAQVTTSGMQTLLDLPLNTFDNSLFSTENGFKTYAGAGTAYIGIDISEHQGEIDWTKVKAAGVDFAMIRVGYRGYAAGELNADVRAEENLQGALDAGIAVGAYFFSQAITEDEAREEANYVIDKLSGFDVACPVAFDWEPVEGEARTDGMDSITLTAITKAYCQTIEDAGYRAAIYFNQAYGYQQFNLPQLKNYLFWLAEYNETPSFLYDFQMWQYSNTGTVDGISENVDLNLYFGDDVQASETPSS